VDGPVSLSAASRINVFRPTHGLVHRARDESVPVYHHPLMKTLCDDIRPGTETNSATDRRCRR
jgi:hypothetical protein